MQRDHTSINPTCVKIAIDCPETEASLAVIQKFLKEHNVSHAEFVKAVFPKLALCLLNLTLADAEGNPTVEFSLGRTTLINKKNASIIARRKASHARRKGFDSAF